MLTLLEIAENGQAISWEGSREDILNEAVSLIYEQLDDLPNDSFMMKIVEILNSVRPYKYAFTIDANALHGHKFKFEDLEEIGRRSA